MYLISLILAIFIFFILSVFSYVALLSLNNLVWGYKGIPTDKESPAYRKRKRSLKLIAIPLSVLILIIIGLVKSDDIRKSPSSNLTEQVQSLAGKSGRSASNFQKSLISLDKIRELDTIPKIKEAINTVERVQLLFYEANKDSDALSDYINKHKTELRKDGLDAFIDIEGLSGKTYFSHRKALREYLNDYRSMLEYSGDNFEALIQDLQPQSNTYNRLYLRYKTALDAYNEAYLRHMKFVEKYSKEHPEIAKSIGKSLQEFRER